MHIGIDARFYGILGKGLGRYTQQMILHLEKADTENTYSIFLRRENFDDYVPKNPNFHKVLADIPWYSWKEQLVFPFLLAKYRCDVMHFTHFNVPLLYRRPFVLTVHDLILFHFPTLRATTRSVLGYGLKYAMYRIILWSALIRARRIITVSEFTREDIAKSFSLDRDRMSVTYQAGTESLPSEGGRDGEKDLSKSVSKYGILKRYFLYVGNAYPHKNLERLLLAFQEFRNVNTQLVLVGKTDYFYDRLRRFVEKRKIRDVVFTGEVTDEELVSLYQSATAYIFPSLYEGFGLPPLEAMAQGTPVLSSNRTSLPEVLGSSALYFNPEDTEDMAQKMTRIAEDADLRKKMREEGFAQVKRFSWDRLARETREIYEG